MTVDPDSARLVVSCPDRPGIVAAVAGFLFDTGANVTHSDQHSSDPEGGRFFLRMEFHLPGVAERLDELRTAFDDEVAAEFDMAWRIVSATAPKRMAILVSKYDHCLLDLLWRARRGELPCEVPVVISNHPDLRTDVENFGVPFFCVPVEQGGKPAAEAQMLALLRGHADVVVLARYMQILTGGFLDELGIPVINIHHSFLPAFAGANPYGRARERGVKIVGATAHYVTEELDAGPIIEQDIVRVSHRHDVDTLERLGADVERTVLARAVQLHLDDRVLVDGGTTVVF
ncbi:formyltetrahydrofolate deformylase [Svornostia abyssi]|uniref:Formyltetrahydrofolate deformylase n=1 Tax=Svornostia abyssi TaxID=2898438 RepID=A0ABY5PMQ8_9ACTN|nr:formyltetrahydrofolate deformylase [Parviterribacteraceae bacterium J379]